MYTRILVPWILWDKIIQSSWGVSTMVPPIIFSWSLEDSIEDVKSLDRSVYIYIHLNIAISMCISKWIKMDINTTIGFILLCSLENVTWWANRIFFNHDLILDFWHLLTTHAWGISQSRWLQQKCTPSTWSLLRSALHWYCWVSLNCFQGWGRMQLMNACWLAFT